MSKKHFSGRKPDSWRNQLIKTYYVGSNTQKKVNKKKPNPLISRDPYSPRHKKPKRSWKKILFLAILYFGLFCLATGFIAVLWLSRDLPNPNQLIEREIAQSTIIYDRTGENILYEIHGEEKRTMVNLDDLPEYVKRAPIAIEDKNFYHHGGFSVWAMVRTAITNVLYNRRAGGSTLTQQFIKNAVLSPEKKITRKIKEVVLAYRLEKKFSKDEILQMYLNEIPYGSNAYGIEAASQKYFNKSARDLTLEEAALLAALTQAPSRYSPYGPNKDLLLGRKDYVLTLMREQGYISKEEEEEAKQKEIVFAGPETNITAPHFVMYIKEMLADKYGEKMIEQEGLKIYTTLDLYKQKIAEEVIKEKTETFPEKYNANNAALVSIDPKTGQVLAMVGSRDYFNDEIDGQVNVTLRPRQPGSSLKPLVYAALFIKGYSPETILYDVLTNFSNNPSIPYQPRNYNRQELGPVNVRKALAGSLNIPAVKALYLAGINNVIELAEKAGYTTLYDRDQFGLSLVLGGAEVKLIEHTNAYSAFARDGKMSPIVSILRIEDKNGNIIEEYQPEEKQVFDSQIARLINSILSDNAARAYIFGEKNYLVLPNRPVAAKTGTTNDFHDAWTIGYTPSIVTGVWVGNSNNKEMKGAADGSVLAAPIWNEFMARVLGDTPVETFKEPAAVKTGKGMIDGELPSQIVKIDTSTGQPATSLTPPELISELSIPDYHSILFYVDKNNPLGPEPENPENDPQYLAWEKGIADWAEKNASSSLLILKNLSEFHTPENTPQIKITSPREGVKINDNFLTVNINAEAKRGIVKTDYYINGALWESSLEKKESMTKNLPPLTSGYHSLTVRVCDDVNNCAEESINFNLKNSNLNYKEPSVQITSPQKGTIASKIDFPLSITLSINEYDSAARLLVFTKKENEENVSLVASVANFNGQNYEVYWSNPPEPGIYVIYAELKTWRGDVKKSAEVKINVAN
ncbi:MAG: penicillin-binding protein [Patescibacteria group bacterium]|jgi:1A family penicillin-binding protein|nr:penicillin-binding protein [bacterium]HQC50051.1 penicillin-binding protein [bacterium]